MPEPLVLFVPLYGGGGTGEFVRAVSLAQALARRAPRTRIEFLLPGGPGTRHDVPFPHLIHDGPPQTKGEFDRATLARLRPDLAIFDSGCRTATLRCCRRLGIRSAYVSDRAGTRRKAFRLDWLPLLDAHWHQRELLTAPAFTLTQRLLARFGRARRLAFDLCGSEEGADWNALPEPWRQRLQRPFVLFAPGGGGYRVEGRPVGEIFLHAAEALHAACGVECLTLTGALTPETAAQARHTLARPTLPQPLYLALLRRAQLVITNGGQGLHQALAAGAVCVCAPLGGDDQPGRIAVYARRGWILAAPPRAEDLCRTALELLHNAAARAALRARVGALSLVNGIPLMVDEIERLLHSGGSPR
ncbi:MAG: hypothetical protein IRZ06_07690 [Nevskia sp.]|nr:hypothetical protein [Nevskia sp.]